MKRNMLGTLMLAAAAQWSCQGPGSEALDVRTFELEHIEPQAAVRIIDPYVFGGRGGSVSFDEERRILTVRETPAMLSRIAEVLEQYDSATPSVALHFRIIEADGAGGSDPAIADLEETLREVFRFEGYRLAAETLVRGDAWEEIRQNVHGAGQGYFIEARIREINSTGEGGTVGLDVSLSTRRGPALETGVTVQVGQTMVLGTAQPDPERGALILTVRAEFDEP